MSAFGLWFGDQPVTRTIAPSSLLSHVDGARASRALPVREIKSLGVEGRPLHLLVPEHRLQRQSSSVVSHLWAPPYPSGTFVRLSREVYALSPIACLLQMASHLDAVSLARALFRMCGTYRTWQGEVMERRPLSTLAVAREFMGSAEVAGRPGAGRLRRLLRCVVDGSASPLETDAAILLLFPRSLGGYALPAPELNRRLRLRLPDGSVETRCPDLLWPRGGLAIEVQSRRYHGPDRLGPDAARKTHLQGLGLDLFEVTEYQLQDPMETAVLVAEVVERLGLRRAAPPAAFVEKNAALHRALFGSAGGPPAKPATLS